MSVFMIHAGGWGLRELGWLGNSFVDHGKMGVVVFFVVSAFSLCLASKPAWSSTPYSWRDFYIRRFMRIAPMYYLALAIGVAWAFSTRGALPDAASVWAHLTFANVVLPQYANDILSIEWTIAVEVGLYLIFPGLVIVCARVKWLALALSAITSLSAFRLLGAQLLGADPSTLGYTLPWHLYAFCFGLLAYQATQTPWVLDIARRWRGRLWLLAALLIAGSVMLGPANWTGHIVAVGTALVIVSAYAGSGARALGWKPLSALGVVSYSIYLLHIFGIAIFGPVLAVPMVLAASACTYWLIERPFVDLARSITRSSRTISEAPKYQSSQGS